MGISRSDMDRMIDEHFGYEHNDDVDGVLATLAPDATHDIVGWPPGPSRGRENARAFYEQMFTDLDEGSVTCVKRLYGDNFLIDESIWEGTAPGAPFGIEGKGRPLTFRILHVVEFTDDAQIQRENAWVDLAAIQQQLPQD